MNNVLVLNNIAQEGKDVYDKEKYKLSPDFTDPDAIMVRSKPIHDMEFGKNLQVIARIGAGINNIPVERCTEMGICVTNCPGGNANAVKELVIAAMIMIMRNGVAAMNWVRSLPEEDAGYGKTVEDGKERFKGPEILGKKIAVIGVGNVGSRVAKAAKALGMTVNGYDPYLSHFRVDELSSDVDFKASLEEAIAGADVVTVHTPLNAETKGMICKRVMDLMNDGVYLINYARGGIINNDDLKEALDSGKIAAYATDFPTQEQMRNDKVFFTPHLGSGTPEAEVNVSVMGAHQIIDYLENGNIVNSVNLPDVSFARAEGDRVTIIHENKVGMLGLITEKVVAKGLNIENLVNKARENVAYTILDFNGEVPEGLEAELSAITGVIRVRVIK